MLHSILKTGQEMYTKCNTVTCPTVHSSLLNVTVNTIINPESTAMETQQVLLIFILHILPKICNTPRSLCKGPIFFGMISTKFGFSYKIYVVVPI